MTERTKTELQNRLRYGDSSYDKVRTHLILDLLDSIFITSDVTASAAELNILDGATLSVAELNILDGATLSVAELNILDGATLSVAELNILDGATLSVAELNILDGVTATTAELNILDGATLSVAELNKLDDSALVMTKGSGVAAAETYASGVFLNGTLIITRIVVDLTGEVGSTTDLDIIGDTTAANAHFGQVTAALNGTIVGGKVTCLEVPAGGVTDIDFYSATVGTGTEDTAVTDLTETVLVTSGGVWTAGASKGMTGVPPANDYLYIANGAGGVPGTFSAGKFLIELYGV